MSEKILWSLLPKGLICSISVTICSLLIMTRSRRCGVSEPRPLVGPGGVVNVLEQEVIPKAFNKFIVVTLCIFRVSGP